GRPGVDLEALEAETWRLVEQLRATPPSAAEVERARNLLVTQSLESLQRVGARADRLNAYNQYVRDPGYLDDDLRRYEQVTPAALHAFAREHLDAQRAAVVRTVPQATAGAAP